jgi:hypothetical protein
MGSYVQARPYLRLEWQDACMPSERTTVTELGTGLGMLGLGDIDQALGSRPPVMHSLSPEIWDRLARLRAGGAYDAEFHAAWENGRAFLDARDGLRGRLPAVVEWKGTGRAPGDEVAPIDLRVDHVYLVSCKYLSNILFNVSPAHLFDDLLTGGSARARPVAGSAGVWDWYAEVAPGEYQALYETVRQAVVAGVESGVSAPSPSFRPPARAAVGSSLGGSRASTAVSLPGLGSVQNGPDADDGAGSDEATGRAAGVPPAGDLPARASDLSSDQRDALGRWLRAGWPEGAKAAYDRLSAAVASASVRRWEAAMEARRGSSESMLWRLLRVGSAPYFVLGSSAARSLRLRIATSWDWRQRYVLGAFTVTAQAGGQPRVGWAAHVRDRSTHETSEVAGHIEVRWSHGRFGGLPEAKGYLDTPHHLVPGYFALR